MRPQRFLVGVRETLGATAFPSKGLIRAQKKSRKFLKSVRVWQSFAAATLAANAALHIRLPDLAQENTEEVWNVWKVCESLTKSGKSLWCWESLWSGGGLINRALQRVHFSSNGIKWIPVRIPILSAIFFSGHPYFIPAGFSWIKRFPEGSFDRCGSFG